MCSRVGGGIIPTLIPLHVKQNTYPCLLVEPIHDLGQGLTRLFLYAQMFVRTNDFILTLLLMVFFTIIIRYILLPQPLILVLLKRGGGWNQPLFFKVV